MKSVVVGDGASFLGDSEDLALVWVERHFPFLFPDSLFVEVRL